MKFAICQELFEGWDWARQCRLASQLGYQGLEVAPYALAERITDVSAETRRQMRAQAESCGLRIIGLHWLLAKTEGLHLTTADAVVRRETAEYLIELGNACADFGGELLVFGSPQQRNLAEGVSRDEAYANASAVFRACLPALAERGVRLCIEPLSAADTNFINTCAEAMELIAMVDAPNFLLQQDVKAMLAAESASVPELIARYAPHVGHFHVNDSNRLGPGMGETDFAPIFDALLAVGYDGWVSVEVFDYAPGAERIARESIATMRSTLERVTAASARRVDAVNTRGEIS